MDRTITREGIAEIWDQIAYIRRGRHNRQGVASAERNATDIRSIADIQRAQVHAEQHRVQTRAARWKVQAKKAKAEK